MNRDDQARPTAAFRFNVHRLEAPCGVCGRSTREGVAVEFPTRARGAAAISRIYGFDPADARTLKNIPMTACVDLFWPRIGETPLPEGTAGA